MAVLHDLNGTLSAGCGMSRLPVHNAFYGVTNMTLSDRQVKHAKNTQYHAATIANRT